MGFSGIPESGVDYLVELCSGERRCWRCLGPDARGQIGWRDLESGLEFNEGSLMYAWHIVGPLAWGGDGV